MTCPATIRSSGGLAGSATHDPVSDWMRTDRLDSTTQRLVRRLRACSRGTR
jgi:hypothetical protein